MNRDQESFSRSCKNPKWIPLNDQSKIFIDEYHTSNVFLNTHIIWDMEPAAASSLTHTPDTCLMTSKNQQTSNH